jgi:hypothetical protein
MSDLRFFADLMHAQIAAERRLAEILANAAAYEAACAMVRTESLPRGDAIPTAFHKANEGLCAVRKILGSDAGAA